MNFRFLLELGSHRQWTGRPSNVYQKFSCRRRLFFSPKYLRHHTPLTFTWSQNVRTSALIFDTIRLWGAHVSKCSKIS